MNPKASLIHSWRVDVFFFFFSSILYIICSTSCSNCLFIVPDCGISMNNDQTGNQARATTYISCGILKKEPQEVFFFLFVIYQYRALHCPAVFVLFLDGDCFFVYALMDG